MIIPIGVAVGGILAIILRGYVSSLVRLSPRPWAGKTREQAARQVDISFRLAGWVLLFLAIIDVVLKLV
jgi:hypothetical protein